ncbi:MAG: hypothetical protein SFZ03_10930 [Candidatus Melainabacteria bacterium]|nr:hypothetical protein [Candidatus Melainabacteria bacterium]
MSLQLIQQLLTSQSNQAIQTAGPLPNVSPANLNRNISSGPLGQNNPFLLANNAKHTASKIGVNCPLERPMFLGYRDNQALYGGARLFILS